MNLYLLRHGIAIDRDDPSCPADPDRFLTPRGIKRTRAACRGLRKLGVSPDLIAASPYRRAVETAEIAAKELGHDGELLLSEALLPSADPAAWLTWLASREESAVLAAGHAPHLDLLIARAMGHSTMCTGLEKAGCACVEWSPGGGRLVWLLEPRILKRL
jgi:phosphohistidine phosphatase